MSSCSKIDTSGCMLPAKIIQKARSTIRLNQSID